MRVGEDWFLAFSPERVDPGREDYTTLNTPKVMGGITPACSEVAAAWYARRHQDIHSVSSAEAAEMAKLLENTFRMINIGLVNETGDHVRAPGRGRVGGHRRGCHPSPLGS